jgi:hypothetical protein
VSGSAFCLAPAAPPNPLICRLGFGSARVRLLWSICDDTLPRRNSWNYFRGLQNAGNPPLWQPQGADFRRFQIYAFMAANHNWTGEVNNTTKNRDYQSSTSGIDLFNDFIDLVHPKNAVMPECQHGHFQQYHKYLFALPLEPEWMRMTHGNS